MKNQRECREKEGIRARRQKYDIRDAGKRERVRKEQQEIPKMAGRKTCIHKFVHLLNSIGLTFKDGSTLAVLP